MTDPMQPGGPDGPVIQGFAVRPDGSLQLDYYEPSESTPRGFCLRSLVAPAESIPNLQELMEDLYEAYREIWLAIRNPPNTFRDGASDEDGDE